MDFLPPSGLIRYVLRFWTCFPCLQRLRPPRRSLNPEFVTAPGASKVLKQRMFFRRASRNGACSLSIKSSRADIVSGLASPSPSPDAIPRFRSSHLKEALNTQILACNHRQRRSNRNSPAERVNMVRGLRRRWKHRAYEVLERRVVR